MDNEQYFLYPECLRVGAPVLIAFEKLNKNFYLCVYSQRSVLKEYHGLPCEYEHHHASVISETLFNTMVAESVGNHKDYQIKN